MEKTKYTCSKKNISSCYDCILDYTIFLSQNLTQERDLKNCQNVPKEKKKYNQKSILGWK
jgi:hypothetical protein